MASNAFRTIFILVVLVLNIGCDQVSKIIVRHSLEEREEIEVVRNHVTLTRVENQGAFLSLGAGLPYLIRTLLLSFIPIMFITWCIYFLFQQRDLSKLAITAYCFVIGGGMGNLIDRVMYGSVTDFMHIDFGLFQTGIFNLADVSIMIGLVYILIDYFRKPSMSSSQGDIDGKNKEQA